MEGCGLVVAMVLWLWRQFGGCGGDYWVVMVVIFWVVLCVYVCFFIYFLFFKVPLVDVGLCRWWLSVLLWQWLLVAVVAAVVEELLLLFLEFNILF